MASQQPPAGRTTIAALDDDLLREILLRLPDLPCLGRAAFSCRAFRRAVRSSPAFRRSFRALHPPPLIALFLEPDMEVVPLFPSPCHRADPDLLSADFFGIGLSRQGATGTGWDIEFYNPSAEGYLILMNGSTDRRAAYSPLTQALDLFIYQPDISFEFSTFSSQDGHSPSRVVCVRHERRLSQSTAFVFSSDTMEWQISRKATLRSSESERIRTSMVARGLIYWLGWISDQIVLFDTATSQSSLIDLPAPLKTGSSDESTFMLGETKDAKLCIVDIQEDDTLVSWFMTAATDDDGVVERWMVYRKLSLQPIANKFAKEDSDIRVDLVAFIDGFVYLSVFYRKDMKDSELYLSICLETSEISELFNGAYWHHEEAHPYVMAWPPSLVQSKEESETEFMGDSVADDGPVGTNQASTVLVAALQSFSQALMNDSDNNKEIVAQLDAFLGPSKDDEGSLISKMTSLDAQLRTARDRILRIRPCL
ncbi:unnamed protein product [Alopecurus aequalis]